MDLFVLFIELLFVVLFAATLAQYIQRRDPVSRAVTLTFSAVTALFVVSLIGRFVADPPRALVIPAVFLFFLQPVFTLHLVSLVRRVPPWVQAASLVAVVGTAVPLFAIRPASAALAVVALSVFAGIELLAAIYLLLAARRRRGPVRARLTVAAVSTALFATAILATFSNRSPGQETSSEAAALALVAALGYLVAFVPPDAVQRVWQAGTAVAYTPKLIADAGGPVTGIWRHYAEMAAAMFDGHAVVVAPLGDSGAEILAAARFDAAALEKLPIARADLDALLAIADRRPARSPEAAGPLAERLATIVDARFIRVVRVAFHGADAIAALAILSTHRTLFQASDHVLLESLGSQTAVIAERRLLGAEQEALSARLAASVEALRSASEAKSDFLASMSHELRTPLSAILGFSDLMRQEPRVGDSVAVPIDWIEHVHRGGEHLLTLINDVLDLAKVEAGRLDLRLEPFDLASAVGESINGLRPLAERKHIRLDAAPVELQLVADRGRFRQILYNLLSNAIKYTPDGGTVRVEAAATDGNVRVSVVDTGVGIAPGDQAAVFEEFRQVGDPSERQPGTGLGLALTKRLAEAHGGRVELESARGTGSRFTVVLPGGGQRSRAATDGHAPLRRDVDAVGDVLVVEDDVSAVRLLREYLEPAGYSVRVAPDAEAGLAMAAARKPAAIVLDVLLPGMDGWETLRRLKADAALRDVPVIIVTVVDEREIGLALGAADYLVKPIQRPALLETLERFAPPARRGAAVRVLAVDDEPASLALIRAALEPEGFAVHGAPGGREALDAVAQSRFDLVVCDLVMPDVDGFQVIAALKDNPRTSQIPILVYTGHDLTAADKAKLNGNILGIVTKGTGGRDGLRQWLGRAVRQPATIEPVPDA
ncbi:MAG TPA: response regulator [Candidatus Limnocylindrales bacterium]|nr:response regulator [Candidatus Limnocylindrales bacterium]